MSGIDTGRHLRWPADEFYWAVLDTSVLRSRRRPKELGFLFEAELPVTIDEVQAAYVPLSGDRCLACGIDRARLDDVDAGAILLNPDSIPALLETDVKPEQLNLLTGDFEPLPVRRLARLWRGGILSGLAVCAMLLVIGMHRRAGAAGDTAQTINSATTMVLGEVLGRTVTDAEVARARLMLRARLAELRQTRQTGLSSDDTTDVSGTLAAVCAAWPRELVTKIDSCAVTTNVIAISGAVPTTDDAQRLADALAEIAGWDLQQPSVESTRNTIRVSLRLTRRKEPVS